MVWAWMLWSAYAFGSWNTNGIMVWAGCSGQRMLLALGTRTESWFGHGCSGQRMLLALGTRTESWFGQDALVSVCFWLLEHERNHSLGRMLWSAYVFGSWNTNGIMVWAGCSGQCMLLALGTRTESWFGHGCSGQRMLLALGTRTESWFGHGCSGQRMLLALGTRTELWFGHGCAGQRMLLALGTRTELWFGHGCAGQRMLLERGQSWFWHGCSGQRMLLEHARNHGLGMDALVSVCSWLLEHERNYGLGMDALVSVCSWLLEHERNYGLGMDALVSVCSGIMVWAWMLWSAYVLGTRTERWFGHGCSGQRDAVGRRTNLLALAVFRESRKLQKCSIHCQGQRKQAR